jgi:hypothetical protein
LIQDLRSRIIQRTARQGLQQRELLESVFKEIDTDGSGEINRTEFKSLLMKMDMGYSGKKFMKLYNAIDRNGDGSLSLAELNHLLFPQDAKQKEVEELGLKIRSHLDRRIHSLEIEQLAEADSVPWGVHKKRLGQISSLKNHLKSSKIYEAHSDSLEEVSENIPPNLNPVSLGCEAKSTLEVPTLIEVLPTAHHGDGSEVLVSPSSTRVQPQITTSHCPGTLDNNSLTTTSSPLQEIHDQLLPDSLENPRGIVSPQPSRTSPQSDLRHHSDASDRDYRRRFSSSSMENTPPLVGHSNSRILSRSGRRFDSSESDDDGELDPHRARNLQSFRDRRGQRSSPSGFYSDEKNPSFSNF